MIPVSFMGFGTTQGSFVGPLDIASTDVLWAHSLHAMSAGYEGGLVEVTTDNITFETINSLNNTFDIDSYNTFVGGSDGQVSKFIDQTGSIDATQTASVNQSKIRTSGINGKVDMGGVTTQSYDLAGYSDLTGQYSFYYLVDLEQLLTQNYQWLFDAQNAKHLLNAVSHEFKTAYLENTSEFRASRTTPIDGPQQLTFILDTASNVGRIFLNGLEIVNSACSNVEMTGLITLLSRYTKANSTLGYIETDLVYGIVHDDTTRTAIQNNLMEYAGITKKTDLFMTVGQSNLFKPSTTAGPNVPAGDGYEFTPSFNLVYDLQDVVGSGSCGPAFANEWYRLTGRIALLYYGALGGSGVTTNSPNNWTDGSALYDLTLEKARLMEARQAQTVKGILFGIAQSDSVLITTAVQTKAETKTAFEDLADRLHADFPDAYIGLSEGGNADQPTISQGDIDMRDIDATTVATRDYMDFTYTGAKDTAATGPHYEQSDYNDMGVGMAQYFALKLYGITP